MTNEERCHLKAQLIQAGFWNADEPADPTSDAGAAKELEQRAAEKAGVSFARAKAGIPIMDSIAVHRGNDVLLRVTGNNYAEAICFAAVAVAGVLWEEGDQ